MEAGWRIRESDPALSQDLARKLSVSNALSSILVARGFTDAESARAFLVPRLDNLHDPFLLADMEKASRRILKAIMSREKILIHGDYDVDGITATALLYSLFRMVDADAHYHIPDRLTEGYGMKPERLRQAAAEGVQLLITVDCGISSIEEVKLANELGMDVVVTDHHEPGEELPGAVAVIDPKRRGCSYPFRDLAGVGVAFKLAWAIAQSFSPTKKVSEEFRTFLLDALALVALGTVADVVPLVDENRVFARFGLGALQKTTNPGLRALLERTGLAGRTLHASHIAFRMAPRINAAGRMGRANLGMDLLTTDSTRVAEEVAAELERENRNRQKIERKIFENALELLNASGGAREKVILLSQEGWHPGVTGIVASKLADTFNRPAILIAVRDGMGKGSARSVARVHLYELIRRCCGKLTGFGGHAHAAGFEIRAADIEEFCSELAREADSFVCEESLRRELDADLMAPLADLTIHTVRELDRLRPHGEGNQAPLLVSKDVPSVGRPRAIGRNGSHLSMQLRTGDVLFRAVGFGMAAAEGLLDALGKAEQISVAYVPVINSWRGSDTVELELRDIALNGKSLVYK
jgi:single-stranded-DNA-specific exonuclease